jgi:magnesium-transporting ATPase (P-type)
MSEPGPYPSYPQYPGGAAMPEQPRPPLPDPVRNAFYLMLAGAAVQAVGIVAGLAQAGSIKDAMKKSMLKNDPNTSQSTIDAVGNVVIIAIVIFGLIYIGLWIWMAYANRAGKNWARITGTVFFAILTLSTVSGLAIRASGATTNTMSAGSATTATTVIGVIGWAIGLATVVLLWRGQSSAYFQPRTTAYRPPEGMPPQP